MPNIQVNHRFQRQIDTLLELFQKINLEFQQNYPVDHSLSQIFRRQSKYGSKDRRFISGVIFGFYRWYGWLQQLEEDKQEMALLLGYLLDGNEISDLILAWGEKLELSRNFFLDFECPESVTFEKKQKIIASFIADSKISKLNPDWIEGISDELTLSFQKRATLWIRRRSATDDRILEFLDSKKALYKVHPYKATAIEVLGKVNLSESKMFHQGKVEIQDIASQGVGWICNPKPGERWWDMCAGSGGKALHLASLMKHQGKIHATEIRESMMGELEKRIRKGKWSNIYAHHWDGKNTPDFKKDLHGILVDAPCSCSGTWRRSPYLRWQLEAKALQEFQKTQLKLLNLAASQLKPGGILVYATCSIFPAENEEVIEKFLNHQKDFEVDKTSNPFVKKNSASEFHFTPLNLNGNAMYVARMKRR